MVMIPAAWVEGGAAVGTDRVAFEVGGDGELRAAGAAEDGLGVPVGWGPGLQRVVGKRVVAVIAGVIGGAAFHFDGDDVER